MISNDVCDDKDFKSSLVSPFYSKFMQSIPSSAPHAAAALSRRRASISIKSESIDSQRPYQAQNIFRGPL